MALPVTAANLQKIQTIQISLIVENVVAGELVETAPINTQYSSAFWQQMRLSSRNYRNRKREERWEKHRHFLFSGTALCS